MPSTLVALRITSALISIARSAAAVSVLKYGLPVPAPNTTTRPFSRWRIARRRMNGSATARISMAVTTRVTDALLLERILKRQRVDHRGQHAHVVGGGAIHAARARGDAAEDVAAADDDGRLHAHRLDLADLAGDLRGNGRIDAVALLAHEGFAGEFQEDAFVEARSGGHERDYRTADGYGMAASPTRPDLRATASPTFSRANRVIGDRSAERLVGRSQHVLDRHLRIADRLG